MSILPQIRPQNHQFDEFRSVPKRCQNRSLDPPLEAEVGGGTCHVALASTTSVCGYTANLTCKELIRTAGGNEVSGDYCMYIAGSKNKTDTHGFDFSEQPIIFVHECAFFGFTDLDMLPHERHGGARGA